MLYIGSVLCHSCSKIIYAVYFFMQYIVYVEYYLRFQKYSNQVIRRFYFQKSVLFAKHAMQMVFGLGNFNLFIIYLQNKNFTFAKIKCYLLKQIAIDFDDLCKWLDTVTWYKGLRYACRRNNTLLQV